MLLSFIINLLTDKLIINFDFSVLLEKNFYYCNYGLNKILFFEMLPEIFLACFICYSLVNVFNSKKRHVIQYFKWLIYFSIILVLLIFQFFTFSGSSELVLGFNWLNSYYILTCKLVILGLTIIVLLLSKNKIKHFSKFKYFIEFPIIISFSVLFMFLLLSSYDFFGAYLTIEGLSLTLYVLATLLHQGVISVEASIKYFSLGAIASGSLLLGIVILFGVVGSLDFLEIQNFLGNENVLNYIFEIKISLVLLFFSFFFKVSAFPCHVWVADIYEGVWSPITAFFAIVIKSCLMLFFIRLIFDVFLNIFVFFQILFAIVSLGSIIIGSFGALRQVRIKRFLAYTSISQVGFILLGITSGTILGLFASIMYLTIYILMNIIFFGVFLNINHVVFNKNIVYLSDLYGLNAHVNEESKYLVLTILSMAGLPPLGGFVGKLFIYFAIIESRFDFILIISLLMSLISTYYYLNIVRYVFFEKHLELKLYYYIKKIELTIFLRFFCLVLLSFPLFLYKYFDFFIKLSFSCAWPFLFF